MSTLTVKYRPPEVYISEERKGLYRISGNEFCYADRDTHTSCSTNEPKISNVIWDHTNTKQRQAVHPLPKESPKSW